MVVDQASIMNIMGGMESTAGVRLHNHRRKLRQRFDIIKKLGQGTYGKVQLGINKETGQEVAIKTIKKSKIESEADLVRIRREIQIMSSVQHPNIIHIYEVFENREKMVLVMEYAAGGELYDFLSERKVLGEEEACRLFRQIATAVYYCHKHKICHRDLKLENILLDEHGSAKIADFGLSNVFDETRLLGTFCGSPLYASPEIVQGTPYHGPEVDCWSLGVLLYTLVYGAMPFDGSNFKRLVKQISQGDYFEPKKLSPASPLIRDMLTVSPKKRADIVKICSHWWVNEGHSESCLDIAEHLANQTPVRLDLLLSLAPPMSADKVVVTKDQEGNGEVAGALPMAEGPVRSHSVGSLMELDQPAAERRIRDFVNAAKAEGSKSRAAADKSSEANKRKLEEGISTEDTSVGGAKKKERSRSKQRSSRSDRRSSSRSRKQGDSMDTDSDALVRSDSKDIILAAAAAISQTIGDEPKPARSDVTPEKTEEKRKSVKGVKKKTKTEKEGRLKVDAEANEIDVAEGKSGNEPSQQASIPANDLAALQESTNGKVRWKKKVEEEQVVPVVDKLSDASPSDESVKSSQSDPSVEEVKSDLNGDDTSEGVVSIMSSSTAPASSIALSDMGIDIAGVDKAKSQGKLSLGKIPSPTNEVPVPVAVPVPESPEESSPPRSTERRKSKIFETAEKFNNLASTERKGSVAEKPKKIHIPGVKVSDAKAAFERKSSLTNSTASVLPAIERKGSVASVPAGVKNLVSNKTETKEKKDSESENKPIITSENKTSVTSPVRSDSQVTSIGETEKSEAVRIQEQSAPSTPLTEESARMKKLKDAVEVISNVIGDQVSGRKLSLKKPPKLLSFDGSKPGSPSQPGTPLSPSVDSNTGLKTVRVQVAPNDIRLATIQVSTPQATKYPDHEPPLGDRNIHTSEVPAQEAEMPKKAASKMEITLKSATLPRRKTSKAEIQMGVPPPAKAASPERQIKATPSPGRRASAGQPLGGYRSEVEHIVGGADYPNRPRHQRSEVSFPVAAASSNSRVHPLPFRSASCEPESTRQKPREHIIPIRLEGDETPVARTATPPAKPPVPPTTSASASGNLPYQRTLSQRSSSLSRQSTQDSDTESTISQSGGEPIRKSPREYIIPIAVEGGGYVTPRATSLEPSEDSSRASTHSLPRSRFGRTKRMSRERHQSKFSSLLSESEDERESPFAALHRHSSIGRDSDNEERPSSLHLHRLRSSRPAQRTLEHTDSLSSAEEEDDDEGFEILTAENLFSSLLSRVRSLTQRLNVEDGGRPGFPSSRLFSQLSANPGSRASPFIFPTTMLSRASPFEPLSRRVSETSRSFSRNDSESGSVGPAPWRRSVSRDVSDTDSIYSESLNSGTLPKGRSSGDFSDASSLSSYSYTPSLSARLAQYQQPDSSMGGQTPTQERRSPRTFVKSRSGTDDLKSSTRRYNSQNSYSSARRAARALEEELNGLERPSSYVPKTTPSSSSISVSQTNDDFDSLSSTSRRLGRTLSLRERSSSPSSRRDFLLPSSRTNLGLLDSSLDRGRHIRPGIGSSTNSDAGDTLWDRPSTLSARRRVYNSSLSDSGACDLRKNPYDDKDLPPLPFLPRHTSRDSLKYLDSMKEKKKAECSEEDCTYYEILPYHKKESPNETLTRSCPPSAFLSNSTSTKTDNVSSHEPQIPTANELENISTTKGQEQTDSNLSNRQITEVGRCAEPRHVRSLSVTRDLKVPSNFKMEPQDTDLTSHVRMRRTSSSARTTPDRSILSKFFRHSTSDVKQLANEERSDAEEAGEKKVKPRRISRFLRPDFFDTPREESVYAKEKDMQKAALTHKMDGNEEKEATDKKQSTANKTSSRFLQSLEKKLEKLRGSSNETVTPVPEAEPSPSGRRIESTIRSLREKSLGPKESDSLPTESSLLKRAVSVSDFSPVETQGSKKIGGRVLGLFRRSNESSKKSNEMGTEGGKALIPTFTNKQSKPYLGSRSDSIVLKSDINGKTSVPATPDPSIGISSPISDYKINKIKSSVPEQSATHKDTVTSSVVDKVQDRTTDTGTFVSQCSTSPPLEKDIKSIKKTADQQDHDALSMSLKSLPRNEVSVDSDKPFTKITTASVVVNTETESKLAENVTMEVPNTTSLSVVKRFKTAGESSEDCVVSPLKISSKIKSDKGILISKIKSKVPKLSRKDSSPKISDKGVLSAIPKEEKTVYDSTSDALKGTYAEDYKCDSPAPNMNKLAKAESRTDSSKSEKLDFAKSSSPVKSASKSKVPRQDKSYSSGTSSPTKTVTKIKENKDLDRAVTSSPPKSISKIRERRSNTPTKTSSKVTEEVKSTDTATAKEDTEDKKTAQAQFVSKIIDPKTEDSTSETTLVATADKNVSQVTSNSPTKMVSKKKDVKYVDRPNETSFATHTASDKKNTNATTKSCVVSLSKKKDSKDDKKVPESVAVLVTTEPFIKSKDINEGNKIHESMLTSTVEGISSSAVTAKALLKNSDAKDDFIKKETITTSPASDDNTVSGPTKSSTKSVVKNKGAIEESLICVTTPTPAASEDGKPSRSSTKSSTKSVSKNKDLRDEDKTHEANLILVSGEEAACGSPRTSTKAQKIKDSTKDDKASKTTMGKDNERALQPKSPSPIKTVVEFKDGGSETPSLSVTKDEKVISSTSISRTKLFSKGEGIKDERRTRDSTPTKPTKDDEKSVPNISRSSVKSSSRNKESKDLSPVKKTLKSNASRSSPFTKGSPPRFSRESSVDRRLSAEGSPEKLSKPPSRSPPKPVTKPLNCNLDVKQQGIPRRVPVTQPGLLRRSSSQSRSSSRDSQLESLGRRNSASGNEADIPVVSLKDVERRHRAMLMDKWSKSMQSLNVGKKEEGLPVKELQQTNIPSKKDNKDPNVSEENSSQLVLRADTVKKSKNLTEPGKLTDSKLNEPEDPVEISEIKPKDLKCPMEVSIGASGTSHAVDEVSNPQTSSVLKVATNGADTHQNTLESHEKMTGVPLASAPAPRPRLSLHLDLTPHSPAVRMSRKGTDTFTEDSLLSPTESESVDSWSVCSGDYSDTRDWAAFSPTLSPHSPTTEDTESVSDRIRRKSFYCRFNDIKKKKKPPSSIALSSSAIGSSYTLSPRSRAYPSEFTRSMSSSSGSSAPHYREKPHRSKSLLATSKDMEDSASLPHSYNQKHKSSISPTSALCSSPGHSRTSGVKSHNQNGSSESPLFSSPADRSPSWERSGMEIKNDILFHNLGLHRFDPTNLSVNKRTLLGMLSPTVVSPNQDSSSSPLFGDLAASGTTLVVSEDAIDTAKSGSAPDIDTASGGES